MTGARYTFRANRQAGRHGWLRLTPAYSVGLVEELVDGLGPDDLVLDPFCGTGTTALVCAERGIACDTIDINPFLIWLTRAKCVAYSACDVEEATDLIEEAIGAEPNEGDWRPPLSKIERWWDEATLARLAAAWRVIGWTGSEAGAADLAKVAFCRAMMSVSKASFGHQSMSFKNDISLEPKQTPGVPNMLRASLAHVVQSALDMPCGAVEVALGDARRLDLMSPDRRYSRVITSPPYPNRMSYVRELRPYMYWLGFLADGRAAGELDWLAIGGTWGIATSNLNRWEGQGMAQEILGAPTVESIRARSQLLANYVLKYIEDMAAHVETLRGVMRPGGRVVYVIGNSRFYGTPVETQAIFVELFQRASFTGVAVETLRKRTSKTGLFEYAVSAVVPA